ncbi:FACT complex subunit-domain-containing protein [Peziza echinospora]|nr:FACT complex subunit-domain-containing protein [Peziza echinospora]
MGDEIKIDKAVFENRLLTLQSIWKDRKSTDAFNNVTSILSVMGKTEEGPYSKSLALHFWLLGYEFPATLILITQERVWVVTTAKKAKLLEPMRNGKIPLEILVKGKDEAVNEKNYKDVIEAITKTGGKVGVFAKEQPRGPFVEEWKKFYEPVKGGFEEIDVSLDMSSVLSIKDDVELKSMRAASRVCVGIMNQYFVDEMSTTIDDEKKITHAALAAKIEGKLDDDKFFKSKEMKLGADFDNSQLDWADGPYIQSGGKYDLRFSSENDTNNLHSGVILCSFGLRYKTYCSMIARTFLIDPNKSQDKYYNFLVDLSWEVVKQCRDGVMAKDVYAKALSLVKSKFPELEKHFVKNVGGGIGIEARDPTLTLNAKSSRVLKDGMTLTITVGFHDLENPKPADPKSKTYSLILTDTIRVTAADAVVLTGASPKDHKEVAFFFKDDEPEPKAKEKRPAPKAPAKNVAILKSKLRGDGRQLDDNAEQRRREHQKQLAAAKQEEGLQRFSEGGAAGNGKEKKSLRRFESYKRENQLPSSVKDLNIVVDAKNQTIIVPVMGRPVPFHISTLKNVSKNEEDNYTYLRINFLSPGQGVGKKDDLPFEDAQANFIRSLTYRSTDNDRMAEICSIIQDLKKGAVKREQERKEMEDVITQDNLIEVRNRRPQKLSDVYVRPGLEGKRVPGELEIHQNGLRYQSPVRSDHRIDILFSNVKHLFFQPCAHELIVLIHVHLKDNIMVGKKKTKDVQFYREATDIQFDETGNRKRKYRYGDEEEFEQEQEERRRRALLDKEFKAFADKIAEAGKKENNVDVDVPYRELGFNGVPHRANVLCCPTTDALVQLTDPPFLVITLEEVEVAHLERVEFGLKNFDLVFVFKDFHRPVAHINSIPMESLENVKEWLDSSNIAFTEGPLNLNWPTIMKTVTSDPHTFFVDGGWSFLQIHSDDEDDDEEEEESEFEASGESDSYGSYSDEDSEFDDDDDASADEGSGESDVESGEDWDELEEQAARKDKEALMEERNPSSKPASSSKSGKGAPPPPQGKKKSSKH